ncbi:hypothetical protein PW52_14805 [Tamlana sedimentorum]|uniref:Luciferase-like monooxygenase n=1 Tax=Neotamlana sedimentorum TaxID=1435349 RepID=A0A0D7W5U2_9FLAO|nr:LLM class flavin-dependent oxidoreductase [Tamlana sedimentorum]KJD33192.1 hypothetical protein PW52_14805 [Tamlana sedimentorum]
MVKSKVAYSVLELAIVSEKQTFKDTFNNTIALAKAAENFGYKRFWLAEHHNSAAIGSNATSVLIGHVAEKTKTIKVGSGGIMLPNHSPLIVAEQFGTLGTLYPNRIDLGLGRAPGTDQTTAAAIRSDFFNAAQSFPSEVEKIQNYFSVDNQNEKVRAVIAEGVNVPLYILGSSTDSAYLAAKKGLPYAFASHFAPTHLAHAFKIYHENFQPSESLSQPYTLAGVNIVVADTDAEAEQISTSLYRMIVNFLSGKRSYLQPPTEMTSDLKALTNHPSVQQMLKYTFIGSKETVKAKILDFIKATQVNEIIAVTNIYGLENRIKSYQLFAEIMQEINANKSALV